ncbi:MAG TPA: FAD-dependent oxidoreductase, partial [Bacteroidia bacterium]|nr:FAD-dependent oxidoreductase [Bacteroidia bacterium]
MAGTTLAHSFFARGAKVLVMDNAPQVSSSKVAAGIWNPVVFRKYTQSFMAPVLLNFNSKFYPGLEQQLGARFYYPTRYYKIFSSADDIQHWKGKLAYPDVAEFMEPGIYTGLDDNQYKAPFDAAEILQCGYLDTRTYLERSAVFFKEQNALLTGQFDYNSLVIDPDYIEYQGITAKKIIFCEGVKALDNPWFGKLPFSPAKGEVLTIKADLQGMENTIINKGIFIVPVGEGIFRAGSTYRWEDLSHTPTDDALQELKDKLFALLKVPYEIIEHKAAVRPAIQGRRPVLGLHPHHHQLGIFNGLGSRGVMLAPYFASQLVNHLLSNTPLHP